MLTEGYWENKAFPSSQVVSSSLGKLSTELLWQDRKPQKEVTVCFEVPPRDSPTGEITQIIMATTTNSY